MVHQLKFVDCSWRHPEKDEETWSVYLKLKKSLWTKYCNNSTQTLKVICMCHIKLCFPLFSSEVWFIINVWLCCPFIVCVWVLLERKQKVSLVPQVIWDSSVSVLVDIRAAEPVRHQRESPARVHRVHWGDHVWDIQCHLAGGSAQHAHRHDEQLLPTHRCESQHLILFVQ